MIRRALRSALRGPLALWAAALCLVLSLSPASANSMLSTHALCRAPGPDFNSVEAGLRSLGWQPVRTKAEQSRTAQHVSAGVHFHESRRWKDDWKSFSKTIAQMAEATRTAGAASPPYDRVRLFQTAGESTSYLALWENRATRPDGTNEVHARSCHLLSPLTPRVAALRSLGTPKRDWTELPRATQTANGRPYRISGRYRSLESADLPFPTEARHFVLIQIFSDRP